MKKTPYRASSRNLRFAALALALTVGIAVVAGSQIARASNVSGQMSYRDGRPADKRQLHYENRVTHDMFVAPTRPDGSFTANLPPGSYDLRAERGVILKSHILVGSEDLDIGKVVEPAPLDVRRPFEHEGVADALVDSPAPSTANVTTGRALLGMRYGHEAIAPLGAPGTPAPQPTPLGELMGAPGAAPSPVDIPAGPNL